MTCPVSNVAAMAPFARSQKWIRACLAICELGAMTSVNWEGSRVCGLRFLGLSVQGFWVQTLAPFVWIVHKNSLHEHCIWRALWGFSKTHQVIVKAIAAINNVIKPLSPFLDFYTLLQHSTVRRKEWAMKESWMGSGLTMTVLYPPFSSNILLRTDMIQNNRQLRANVAKLLQDTQFKVRIWALRLFGNTKTCVESVRWGRWKLDAWQIVTAKDPMPPTVSEGAKRKD